MEYLLLTYLAEGEVQHFLSLALLSLTVEIANGKITIGKNGRADGYHVIIIKSNNNNNYRTIMLLL